MQTVPMSIHSDSSRKIAHAKMPHRLRDSKLSQRDARYFVHRPRIIVRRAAVSFKYTAPYFSSPHGRDVVLTAPLTEETVCALKVGDAVLG